MVQVIFSKHFFQRAKLLRTEFILGLQRSYDFGGVTYFVNCLLARKRDKKKLNTNSLIIIATLIDKIPPTLPLPAFGRKKIPKGGVTPLWQRGARGDFPMSMSIQF